MGLHVSYLRGMSVVRGTAHSSHDDLMPITGERHWQAAGTEGRPGWPARLAQPSGRPSFVSTPFRY